MGTRCWILREMPHLCFLDQNILRNPGCINRDTGLLAGSSLHRTFSLRPRKSSSRTHPAQLFIESLFRNLPGLELLACCQEQLMISRNGLCLNNIWMQTKSLSQPSRCFIHRTLNGQMFQVHSPSLPSAAPILRCLFRRVCPPRMMPRSLWMGGHPCAFLQLKLLVTLVREDTNKKVLLQKSRLRNNPMGRSGQGPSPPHTSLLSAPVFLIRVHCLFERVPGFETTELNPGVRCY